MKKRFILIIILFSLVITSCTQTKEDTLELTEEVEETEVKKAQETEVIKEPKIVNIPDSIEKRKKK